VTYPQVSYNLSPLEARPWVDYTALSADELAIACFQVGDEPAWAEFVRRFHPLIAGVAFRVACKWGETSPQVIDDLVQDTFVKVCAERAHLLRNFRSSHKDAIYAYMKVFAANLAHDYFKAQKTRKRGGGNAAGAFTHKKDWDEFPDSKAAESAIERDLLIRQIDTCLKVIAAGPNSDRDRKIFWLYYRVGLSARAIAAFPAVGLTTKGVESTIARLTRQVREQLSGSIKESRLRGSEGIGPEESF
jgi:RNA polymerase sigma-70 factor, ECF subfamily